MVSRVLALKSRNYCNLEYDEGSRERVLYFWPLAAAALLAHRSGLTLTTGPGTLAFSGTTEEANDKGHRCWNPTS